MTVRICAHPCCPAKIPADARDTRCDQHRRERDLARGTRQDRGYDAEHDRLRAEWQRRLDAGEIVVCWRCKAAGRPHPIDPNHWHLGHDDHDRTTYRGPECPAGNLATSGRLTTPRG